MIQVLLTLLFSANLSGSAVPFLTTTAVEHYQGGIVQGVTTDAEPQLIKKDPLSLGIATTATAAIAIDHTTGATLYAKNPHDSLSLASITKLLTVVTALNSGLELDQEVTILSDDIREGNIVYLAPGETVTVRQLISAALIASANEAAVALARASGIEDFATAMNTQALELGMYDSQFIEPTGLSEENISTVVDVVTLARYAFDNPVIQSAATTPELSFTTRSGRSVSLKNTNQLFNTYIAEDYRIIGTKTGYLDEAGYCLVVSVSNSAGHPITIALLGSNSQTDRWQEAKGLIDWVYRTFDWR